MHNDICHGNKIAFEPNECVFFHQTGLISSIKSV